MNSPHIGHSFGICSIVVALHFLDNPQLRFYRGCKVMRPRRSDQSRLALETLVPHERDYRRSLADEVAIDFPSSRAAIEFFRRDHGEPEGIALGARADITISASQAAAGATVPLEVQVPFTCACCGGRGEVWSEPCEPCGGKGQELVPQRLTVAVRPGAADGDRFSFTMWLPRGPRTRVDVRVAVTA